MLSLTRISARKAYAQVEDEGYCYLDVRSVAEFGAGHVTGAYNIPLLHPAAHGMTPNETFVSDVERVFDRDQGLVVGCQSGVRSVQAAEVLIAAGFTRIMEQRGGFSGSTDAFGRIAEPGWQQEGLPVSYEPLRGRTYQELKSQSRSRRTGPSGARRPRR